jgi:EAL domain-containing protein (putative c-di-GMP-specific phosphodiesterase class I)/GGDEF domain-containing protein
MNDPTVGSDTASPEVEAVLRDLVRRGLLRAEPREVRDRLAEPLVAAAPPPPEIAERDGPAFFSSCGLRNLRVLNQLYGAGEGDLAMEVLRAVVVAVLLESDPEALLLRVPGPEVVVLHGPLPRTQVEAVARRIRDLVASVSLPTSEGRARLRPGVASLEVHTPPALPMDAVLRTLHLVRSRALRADDGLAFLEGAEAEEALRSLQDRDLGLRRVTQALERGEVEAHFQPVIDLRTGRLGDVEALARIRAPERLLNAGEFIGLVHELGETAALDSQVLHRVGEHARDLARVTERLFVNVSPLSLASSSFREVMSSTVARLRDEGLNLLLVLELTEQALLEHHEVIREIHRAHGVSFAVDDFGAGYSSLKTVSDLAVSGVVSTLKIDGSLIRQVTGSAPAYKVVLAAAHLAKGLDLRTVAEHVETPEVLARLRSTGIEWGQGFLFDAPLPAEALVARYAGQVPRLPEAPPRRELRRVEPFLHRAFAAFYDELLSDPQFARYFRDEAQIRDLVERQQQTFLESLDDDAEALRRRYVRLGRLHHDLGLPLATFLRGADLLHEELLAVLVHATSEIPVFHDAERFFAAVRNFMARGYLERKIPRVRADMDALRSERGDGPEPSGRPEVLRCLDALVAAVVVQRAPIAGTPAQGLPRPSPPPEGAPGPMPMLVSLEACPATAALARGAGPSAEAAASLHREIHGDAESLGFFLARDEDAAVVPLLEGLLGRYYRLMLELAPSRP